MRTELERYKETLSRYTEALGVAKEALAQLNGADNRAFTSHHAQEAASRIEAILAPPPPEMETLTVERWECAECGEVYKGYTGSYCGKELPSGKECQCVERIKLIGTYQRPLPVPVERSAKVTLHTDGTWSYSGGDYPIPQEKERVSGEFTWKE